MSKRKFEPIFYRSANNYDVEEASNAATIPAELQGESLTVQSMSEDADINVLMRRYGITGKLPENPRVPMYGDFTGVKDFQTALEAVLNAQEMFMEFPADLRGRFKNDPQLLLEFVSDEANVKEAVKLGLIREDAIKRREDEASAARAARHAEILEAARAAGMRFEEAPKKEGPKVQAPGST